MVNDPETRFADDGDAQTASEPPEAPTTAEAQTPAAATEQPEVGSVVESVDSNEPPVEAAPQEGLAAEAAPAESGPAESAPAESAPAESAPAEDGPAEDGAGTTAASDAETLAPPESEAGGEAPAEEEVVADTTADDADADAPSEDSADSADDVKAKEPARLSTPGVGERPAISAPRDIGDIPNEMSAEDFAAVIERTVFEFKEGDIVAGTVVRVDPDEALVDIGYKSEGVIPAGELSIRNSAAPSEVVSVGDEIEALVLQKEDEQGRLVLSKKRAQYERAWGRIERVMSEGGSVTGPVIEVVKGGLIVDIGLRGFLPASLVDLRRVRDLHPFVGEDIEAKVIELDKNRNNVVLSRRAFLEEAQAEQRQAFLSDLEPGAIRQGVVSSVVNFGAFVDLGGMDGLVHVSELSWQHVSHPGEIVSVGDEVTVKVLEVDRDRERISLSIRQTKEDPWEEFVRDAAVGNIIDGSVTKTVPFGAFISVGEGVEGLVHVSEIALHHVESPELELSLNQQVRVKITEIDADRRRVSLSIKQGLPEWEERSTWTERKEQSRPRRREFELEDETTREPAFNADASLEAILQELKEKGIGRS